MFPTEKRLRQVLGDAELLPSRVLPQQPVQRGGAGPLGQRAGPLLRPGEAAGVQQAGAGGADGRRLPQRQEQQAGARPGDQDAEQEQGGPAGQGQAEGAPVVQGAAPVSEVPVKMREN